MIAACFDGIFLYTEHKCPNLGAEGTVPKRVQAGRVMEIEGDHQLQSITASSHARLAAGRLADRAELGSSIPCS